VVRLQAGRATEKGRFTLDVMKLKVPVFGPLFHKIAMSRFARNLSTCWGQRCADPAGAGDHCGHREQRTRGRGGQGRSGFGPGRPVDRATAANHDIFPPMVVQMIAVGEETGNVDGMLDKVADFYDTEIEATTESLTAMMEPLMIGVIGGIVGGMVIALYLPMFQIFDLIE
jgi:type IV pilus assembly protein PilC